MSAKPASPAQLAANRANAQKSTGPRTPRGKAVSSRNAMKHGLLSQHFILSNDPAETEAAFTTFLNAITAQFQPRGPDESLLVERIAISYWRLARAARFEARSIDRVRGAAPARGPGLTPSRRPHARRCLLPDPADLEALIRYETLIDRELHRAMNALHELRTQHLGVARRSNPKTCPPAAGNAAREKENKHIKPKISAFLTPPGPTEAQNM